MQTSIQQAGQCNPHCTCENCNCGPDCNCGNSCS